MPARVASTWVRDSQRMAASAEASFWLASMTRLFSFCSLRHSSCAAGTALNSEMPALWPTALIAESKPKYCHARRRLQLEMDVVAADLLDCAYSIAPLTCFLMIVVTQSYRTFLPQRKGL